MEWRTFGQLMIFFGVLGGFLILLIGMGIDPWTALKLVGALVGLVRGFFALTPDQELADKVAQDREIQESATQPATGPRQPVGGSTTLSPGALTDSGGVGCSGLLNEDGPMEPEGEALS